MTNCRCIFSCDHERHKPYHEKFNQAKNDKLEQQYYWGVAKYVMDPNLSPSDADDLELFQDIVFDGPWGRVHIFFYEQLFKNYYKIHPDWVLKVFARYVLYLNKVSSLFAADAYHFIFQRNDVKMIEGVLKELPYEIKMQFIQASRKYPNVMLSVPKLRLYNLFS